MTVLGPAKKFFVDRKFYFHIKRSGSDLNKSAELIRLFGGQIEQFLDNQVSYVLTDVPKNEWPPRGRDPLLEAACKLPNPKIMSLDDLLLWCSKYVSSQSSSDDDDEAKATIRELKRPFIKIEDIPCRYAPTVKELSHWPQIIINDNIQIGRSFFDDPSLNTTPNCSNTHVHHPNNSAQLTQQVTSIRTATHNNISTNAANNRPLPALNLGHQINFIPTNQSKKIISSCNVRHSTQPNHSNMPNENEIAAIGVKRRHSVYCEICNLKISQKIEEHIQCPEHRANTDKVNWNEVNQVIESLPSMSTLNKRRLTNITPPNGIEHQEFLCLHKVDSVSQLFQNLAPK